MAESPHATPRSLGEVLGFLQLLWAVAHGLESISKRLQASVGVTGPQRLVVRLVGQFVGACPGDLAEVMCVPSSLTGMLRRLEQGASRHETPRSGGRTARDPDAHPERTAPEQSSSRHRGSFRSAHAQTFLSERHPRCAAGPERIGGRARCRAEGTKPSETNQGPATATIAKSCVQSRFGLRPRKDSAKVQNAATLTRSMEFALMILRTSMEFSAYRSRTTSSVAENS